MSRILESRGKSLELHEEPGNRMNRTVAIVGYGSLGRAMHAVFPGAVVFDEPLSIGAKEAVNACDFAFIAVPTPQGEGGACDTSVVEAAVHWISGPVIVILSTVAVGTTERLVRETGKRIIHQPAYGPGETAGHPYADLRQQPWIILGGERRDTVQVADLYKMVFNAETAIWQTDSRTAELTKYMENAFLALKVAFCNEMYDIAGAVGVDYNELRELWLLDPRIGRSHTLVYPHDRGFGGKCLPKDAQALVHTAAAHGAKTPLLSAMLNANDALRGRESRKTVDVSSGDGHHRSV